MNELTESALAKDLNAIDSCVNVEEIIHYLNKLNAIKYLLDKERRFRENAIKFATLHVAALVKIAMLGGASEISNARVRKTAEWLATLTDGERDGYVSRCADGVTIDYIWKKEIEEPRLAEMKEKKSIEKAQSIVSGAISAVKADGVVDTSKCVKAIYALLPDNPKLARDISDGMRSRLLDSGAIGVGFDSGLYINPIPQYKARSGDTDVNSKDAEYWRNIRSAIKNRFYSVCADLKKLHSIIAQSNIELAYYDFIEDSAISRENVDFYELCVTLMIADMGLIDKEILYDKLDRSFDYKKRTRDPDFVGKYKTGKEYFVGTLAVYAKHEFERDTDSQIQEREVRAYELAHPPMTEEEISELWKQEGQTLREARIAAGLTQKELAKLVGINSDYISMFENGKRRASYDLRERILKVAVAEESK